MAESSGELLGGRYRLLGERAAFPFGAWWEAEDDQGARTVVLRMHPEVVDPAKKAKDAVDIGAKIDTPHLVPWADGGVDQNGHGWLAAPMFGPWSLIEHVSRGEGGVPPAEAAPLMHQLARAIASGEKAGVMHHALSSELVRLVPLPEGGYGVKIYGYGLADMLPAYKPLRKQDAYLGVPDYMSPEMCGGKASEGASADIYAVGILMYEAVRGRPPFAPTFASASASTTLKRHIFEKPLPLHVRYANAPFIKSYEAICFKALAKTANRRQATVAELEKELELLLTEEMRAQIVPLTAISGRNPSTSRRLRTQVLPSVPLEAPSVVVAPEPEPEPEPTKKVEVPSTFQAASTVMEMPKAEERAPAEVAEKPRRQEGTLVFAGLGPAVREMAENAKAESAKVEAAKAEAEAAEASDESDDEGSTEEEAISASATPLGGKKGKKKKGRKGSTGAPVVSNSAPTSQAARPVAQAVASVVVSSGKSEAATGETPAASASAMAEPKEARVRRKDDQTVRNPHATDAAVAAGISEKRRDEQEEWFNKGEEQEQKPQSKAWLFLLLAAAVVVVVVLILTMGGKSEPAQPKEPAGAAPGSRYAIGDEKSQGASKPGDGAAAGVNAPVAKPDAAAAVEAKPAEVAPVEAKPAEVAPVEAKPAEVAPVEAKPAEVVPVEAKPAEVKPAETKPVVAQPPVVKPAETKPVEAKPAVVKPVETKPVEAKPAVVKPAETKPAETKPAAGSPEDQFKAQAANYMNLGIDAFKKENYKLAAGYFKRAQDADPSNKTAGVYLKRAQEKLAE